MRTIGAYEAKTHLPRLLDEVERGRTITITKRGRPVARLEPPDALSGDFAAFVRSVRELRSGLTPPGVGELREDIEHGRR